MIVPALAHQVAYALVHGYPAGSHQRRHRCHDAVIARRNHQRTLPKNGYKLKHVVVVRSENRQSWQLSGNGAASCGVQALHGHKDREHVMPLAERRGRSRERGDVVPILAVNFRPRSKKIRPTILAFLICAGDRARGKLSQRSAHRPHERMNRTQRQNRCAAVPACIAQRFARVLRRMRLESPRRVGAKLGGNPEFAQNCLRFEIRVITSESCT